MTYLKVYEKANFQMYVLRLRPDKPENVLMCLHIVFNGKLWTLVLLSTEVFVLMNQTYVVFIKKKSLSTTGQRLHRFSQLFGALEITRVFSYRMPELFSNTIQTN